MKTTLHEVLGRGRSARWARRLRRHSGRRWFTPLMGTGTLVDSFAPVMPTQTLLITLAVLHPRRWLAVGLWFALGGVLGGGLLALVVETWTPTSAVHFLEEATAGGIGRRAQTFVKAHGAWALFALTLAPWPMRTGVVLCALVGVPWFEIVAALAGGRCVAFPGLAWVASHSPALLNRFVLPRIFKSKRRVAVCSESAAGDQTAGTGA